MYSQANLGVAAWLWHAQAQAFSQGRECCCRGLTFQITPDQVGAFTRKARSTESGEQRG